MASIQGSGGMAHEAFRAALRAQQQAAQKISGSMPGMPMPPAAPGMANAGSAGSVGAVGRPDSATAVTGAGKLSGAAPTSFAESLQAGMREVGSQVSAAEKLPEEMVNGEVGEFHEVALKLKQSDLSFRFALQVRNKLIDAYREVMRMSV